MQAQVAHELHRSMEPILFTEPLLGRSATVRRPPCLPSVEDQSRAEQQDRRRREYVSHCLSRKNIREPAMTLV